MKDRHLDILTGMLLGGLIGVFYPLTAYVAPLVVFSVILAVRLIAAR